MAKKRKLTIKELRFIEEYIRCWNGAKAARLAGYSEKSAYDTAYENLRKPEILEQIDERLAALRMQTNEIYGRLSQQARVDMSEMIEFYDMPVIDKEGKNLGTRQAVRMKEGALEKYGHLIKAVVPTSYGDYKIELHNSQTALELMGKTWSLFVDKDEKGKPIQPVVNVYIPKNDRDTS